MIYSKLEKKPKSYNECKYDRHPQCPLQDTSKLIIIDEDKQRELLEIAGTLYACADDYYDEYAEHQYNKLKQALGDE